MLLTREHSVVVRVFRIFGFYFFKRVKVKGTDWLLESGQLASKLAHENPGRIYSFITYKEYHMTQEIPNINDFALIIHQISKGFWDAERNVGELFMIMVNEASECHEADRKGRWARIERGTVVPFEMTQGEAKEFEISIKNTVEDELADIVILLADTCGFLGLDLFEVDRDYDNQEIMEYRNVTMDNFSDRLLDVCAELIKLSNYLKGNDPRTAPSVDHKNVYIDHASKLASVVYSKIVKIADDWDIDLKWHVHAKVAFNKTRAYKHGKKY